MSSLRVFKKAHDLFALGPANTHLASDGTNDLNKPLPIDGCDPHALMRKRHVPPTVVHLAARCIDHKVDEGLKVACVRVLAAIGPKAAQRAVLAVQSQ